MSEKALEVQMFGDFVVSYGDTVIIEKDARSSMLTHLMQYLMVNRNQLVTQIELIDVLLGDRNAGKPSVTLKNIVYRLRKLLESGGIDRDCIIYKKSAYGFCCDILADIDIEKFVKVVEKLRENTSTQEEKMNLCFEALDLYKGEFLPRMSNEPWVMKQSLYYQTMYLEVIQTAYEIADELEEYERILPQLKKASALYPYEEEIYLLHITCLHKLDKTKEAIAEYELVTAILFDDLGVGPPDRLRELYKKITAGIEEVSESIVDIRNKMNEMTTKKGPYLCNLETFANIYQFAVRHMDRSGKSVFLMLCSLTEEDDVAIEAGERLKRVMTAAREAIRLTCRRGDVFTRYSPTQYLIMLMEIKQENCDVVAGRLRRNFCEQPRMSRIHMNCRCISAADMDVIMNGEEEDEMPAWDE